MTTPTTTKRVSSTFQGSFQNFRRLPTSDLYRNPPSPRVPYWHIRKIPQVTSRQLSHLPPGSILAYPEDTSVYPWCQFSPPPPPPRALCWHIWKISGVSSPPFPRVLYWHIQKIPQFTSGVSFPPLPPGFILAYPEDTSVYLGRQFSPIPPDFILAYLEDSLVYLGRQFSKKSGFPHLSSCFRLLSKSLLVFQVRGCLFFPRTVNSRRILPRGTKLLRNATEERKETSVGFFRGSVIKIVHKNPWDLCDEVNIESYSIFSTFAEFVHNMQEFPQLCCGHRKVVKAAFKFKD